MAGDLWVFCQSKKVAVKSSLFFCQLIFFSSFSPTETVLMLITYHRNFCSHHGHHHCRGKMEDMMAFLCRNLGAQDSPTYVHCILSWFKFNQQAMSPVHEYTG